MKNVGSENLSESGPIVKCGKSNLVKNKKKKNKGKSKKRVTFSDADPVPERPSVWRRVVRFFNFLWDCSKSAVGTALRKFASYRVLIISRACLNPLTFFV